MHFYKSSLAGFALTLISPIFCGSPDRQALADFAEAIDNIKDFPDYRQACAKVDSAAEQLSESQRDRIYRIITATVWTGLEAALAGLLPPEMIIAGGMVYAKLSLIRLTINYMKTGPSKEIIRRIEASASLVADQAFRGIPTYQYQSAESPTDDFDTLAADTEAMLATDKAYILL